MVKRLQKQSKYAFTMIELIFAIVIIAISVVSLPMISQVTNRSSERNLVQEAIFASAAEITLATTYVWDENSLIDEDDLSNNLDRLSRVIKTANGINSCSFRGALDAFTNAQIIRRSGHINRRCLDNTAITLFAGANVFDGLEAAAHGFSPILVKAQYDAAGYKQQYQSQLQVNYPPADAQFGNTANDPDIKEIVVTIQDATGQDAVVLRTYSSNIGEVAYARRFL